MRTVSVWGVVLTTTAARARRGSARTAHRGNLTFVAEIAMTDPLDFALIVSDSEPIRASVEWQRGVQRILVFGAQRFLALRAVCNHGELGMIAMVDAAGWDLLAEIAETSLSELRSLYLGPKNWALLEADPVPAQRSLTITQP